jgi:hypothetical protein
MHGFVSGSRWRCPDPLPFLYGVSAALCVRTSDVHCKRDSMNQCPHLRPFYLRWSPHLSQSLSGLPVFNNARVATRDAADAAYITEATLKKQTVGARLAANVAEEGTSALDLRGRDRVDEVTTLQMRRKVNALFGSARKRLTRVVRLGVTKPEVELTTEDDSLALLEQWSSPVHWTLAIESPRHAFHEEWLAFRQWALKEDLFLQLVERPHPVLARTRYLVRASPLK